MNTQRGVRAPGFGVDALQVVRVGGDLPLILDGQMLSAVLLVLNLKIHLLLAGDGAKFQLRLTRLLRQRDADHRHPAPITLNHRHSVLAEIHL